MPQFSSDPPVDPRGHSLELRRTPTGRPIAGVITSPNMVGCPTHFWGGRTVPHEKDGCEPCQSGIDWRWHGYVSVFQLTSGDHFLFEFTARTAEPFKLYRQLHGGLRGCLFEAKRVNSAANAKVSIRTKTPDLSNYKLPEPPDLVKLLCMIWNIPTSSCEIVGHVKDVPLVEVNTKGNGQQWEAVSVGRANAPPPPTPPAPR